MATAMASPPPPFSSSSSLSAARPADTASPIYPERAIRPLPRNRLKSKLSPEQASSIIYPPDPPSISPTLGFGENLGTAAPPSRVPNGVGAHEHFLHALQHHHGDNTGHTHCTCEEDADSGEEEIEFDHPDLRYATPTANGTAADPVLDNVQRRLLDAARASSKSAPPPASAASSADGYESFENTSNKKKRKIPLSAASSIHHSQLTAELASMGLSGPLDGALDDVHGSREAMGPDSEYYSLSPSVSAGLTGTGISGAGRGRYGRQNIRGDHVVRRPLGSSSVNAANGYQPRPPSKTGGEARSPTEAESENTGGIISQAIKSAAEQGPITPQKGQEIASLLQTATNYSTPANSKTQFTFSVDSESATKMADQAAAAAAQASYGMPTGTARTNYAQHGPGSSRGPSAQTPQSMPSNRQPNGTPAAPNNNPVRQSSSIPPQPPAQPPKPRPRRRPSKEYALAARQRQLNQQYTNYHHRPTKENIWLCQFCEYEAIFGARPEALIRQYEIKDRQERKRQAEKRRLLEKAKAKNRKGKKGGKKGNNNNGAAATNAAGGQAGASAAAAGHQQPYDPNLLPPDGEEYYDDEDEADDYEPLGPEGEDDDHHHHPQHRYPAEYYPPPVPTGTPLAGGGSKSAG